MFAEIEDCRDCVQDYSTISEALRRFNISLVIADDIDSNIENSYAATTQANRQLGKAVTAQKSNNTMVRELTKYNSRL